MHGTFAAGVAQGRGSQSQPLSNARVEYFGAAEENVAKTSHTVRMNGSEIRYTATVGTIPIRLDNNDIAARMFFVAYTKDGENKGNRPIAFLFNGGPGAASIWLHMGSFAPKHVRMAEEGFQPAPPFRERHNDNPISPDSASRKS
jgi:carboxypeptidase C (cathepsin A)